MSGKRVRRTIGIVLLVPGALALIVPQANLGLTELRWMSRYSFPGEALVGIAILALAYSLLGRVPATEVLRNHPPD
jgi:hypothetical protein